jgi:hypothetical protein
MAFSPDRDLLTPVYYPEACSTSHRSNLFLGAFATQRRAYQQRFFNGHVISTHKTSSESLTRFSLNFIFGELNKFGGTF